MKKCCFERLRAFNSIQPLFEDSTPCSTGSGNLLEKFVFCADFKTLIMPPTVLFPVVDLLIDSSGPGGCLDGGGTIPSVVPQPPGLPPLHTELPPKRAVVERNIKSITGVSKASRMKAKL
ncbi:hypothetical protein HUJ05_002226 [Dendroctonus ponderosae]|nr:hypothetical protein HUJ05_002226 [Dendroctonus ponderosae]